MSDEKPKRRTLAEIVRELVHSGNHVDLKDDVDALVKSAEPTETTSDEGDGEKNAEES